MTVLAPRAVAPAAGRAPEAPSSGVRRRRRTPGASPWWALVFLGPTALGLAVFYLWPTVRTLIISFTKSGPFGGSEWIGFENYVRLFQDPELLGALRNTAVYTVIALIGIPLAVGIAALLNTTGLTGRSAYRTLYFIPVVTMPAAIALVWRMIYNGDYGVLNAALGAVGIDGRSWLTDPNTALIAIAVVGIWAGLGTNIVIFLAGLQGIPDTIMEAADLDGAGPVRKFFSITIPLLSPSIFFVSVISVIGALQVFDLIYMMLGRSNPAMPNTRTVVYLFYEAGFLDNDRGYAAAVAFLLLLIILVLTIVQFRLQKKWVHYE
ncbi:MULTISPECIES: carbohydrate ABC transporter permease [Microbacterium]|uniref:carbohydrate ABC transporter permease n=1 Tax=Microbacterium TaxID=33882 RepID=UPI002285C7AD|nr:MULTISPECIES: sugar ABC transporter permease [Microbacterium]MCZ0711292.1 sugar ABC transporter permease [Microbacterium paraoxydans]MDH5131678.1 sugar ABC transporter permease [Microbacterium sp. RD10]MDH5138367.1 sugar ABC transporter permease [Microbacterium sp. RD11]MDH5144171.1 sugar ABC transporter permease [Microbacterium sp. RD12]MDH5153802.1 sugar ABC transporter permease [Microbacterium sp. RD06]